MLLMQKKEVLSSRHTSASLVHTTNEDGGTRVWSVRMVWGCGRERERESKERTLYLSSGSFLFLPPRLAAAPMMNGTRAVLRCARVPTTHAHLKWNFCFCCVGEVSKVGREREERRGRDVFGASFDFEKTLGFPGGGFSGDKMGGKRGHFYTVISGGKGSFFLEGRLHAGRSDWSGVKVVVKLRK